MKKIYNELTKVRNQFYPKNEILLHDISNIIIDLPFCIANESFLNHHQYTSEKFTFFTTQFQLKLLSKAEMILMDGTFKSATKNYYQTLNILAYLPDEDMFTPIANVRISSKTEEFYSRLFKSLLEHLNELNIKVKFEEMVSLTDFEKGLRKAISNVFIGSLLEGLLLPFLKRIKD